MTPSQASPLRGHARALDIPALDGLRALACLLVVYSHMSWTPFAIPMSGEIGVAIFFSLSGYLMAHLYLRQQADSRALLNYTVARTARIVPIYWLTIVAAYALTLLIGNDWIYAMNSEQLLRHLLFTGTTSVFWSISPEIQYYVFFVAIWLAVYRARRGQPLAAVTVLLAISLFWATSTAWPGIALPSKILFFVLGSAAACVPQLPARHHLARYLPLLAVTCLLSMVVLTASLQYKPDFYRHPAAPLLSSLLVYFSAHATPLLSAALGHAWLALIGKGSFAIYLFHSPILELFSALHITPGNLLSFGVIFATTTAICVALHLLVELPLYRRTRKLLQTRAFAS